MILGFKQKFPDGTATNFKEKIWQGEKIHSLRESDRFRAGMSIQMAYGVRTKHYQQFNKGIESLSKCISRQRIFITYNGWALEATVGDNKYLAGYDMQQLIKNDGLTEMEFINWFFPDYKVKDEWSGFIIHWTDFKY